MSLEIKIIPIEVKGKFVCLCDNRYLSISYDVFGNREFKLYPTALVLGAFTYFTLKEAKFVAKEYLKSIDAKNIKTV